MRFSPHNKKVIQSTLTQLAAAFGGLAILFALYRMTTSVPNSSFGAPVSLVFFLTLAVTAVAFGWGWWHVDQSDSETSGTRRVFAGSSYPAELVSDSDEIPVEAAETMSMADRIARAQRLAEKERAAAIKQLDQWDD